MAWILYKGPCELLAAATMKCMFYVLFLSLSFFFFVLEGCGGDSKAKREGEKKEGVKGGEGKESTPKLVLAGPHREVPLLFKFPSLSTGRWSEKTNT